MYIVEATRDHVLF